MSLTEASALGQQQYLRPVSLRHDLAAIADLLELCFTDMDSSGRAAVREMRMLAHSGPMLWLLQNMDRMLKGLGQGFVWQQGGQLVGNVSIYPAGYSQTWAVVNVAVHPDFRRRGIAYALCEAALARIQQLGGRSAILQVDVDNEGAQRIYTRLGFQRERIFTRWRWRALQAPPLADPLPQHLTYLSPRDWQAAYHLAELVRPPQQGGIGWLRPTHARLFRPSLRRSIGRLLAPNNAQYWVLRREGQRELDALILTDSPFGSAYLRLEMLVHPQQQGHLETPLLNYFMRYAYERFKGILTEHPADDQAAVLALKAARFKPERSQLHMRCSLQP